MAQARDEAYCHWTACRAVARAALHMGIEGMSQETLDTLAGVLLAYLDRIAQTASHGVEASGRSSAHTNVLDAVRAVELCTEAAVQKVHLEESQVANSNNACVNDTSWHGLASFLFGPNWKQDEQQTERTGRGGKVGPSSTNNEETPSKSLKRGWQAPFPDELGEFPQRNTSYQEATDDQQTTTTQDIPDHVYTPEWGDLQRKRETTMDTNAAPSKKAKLDNAQSQNDRPMYVPVHFPSFPKPSDTLARTLVELSTYDILQESNNALPENNNSTTEPPLPTESTRSVRSALVELGRYWGSGWDQEEPTLAVPAGRSNRDGPQQQQIVPLGRASGSRVSRILEGSMDVNQ